MTGSFGVPLGGRLAGVNETAPHSQCPEHSENEPMHVEERKPVGERVVGRPPPRLGQRIEVGRDGVMRDHHALRQARRSRCVHDDGRVASRNNGMRSTRGGGFDSGHSTRDRS